MALGRQLPFSFVKQLRHLPQVVPQRFDHGLAAGSVAVHAHAAERWVTWGMLGPMSDDGLLAEQLAYYRQRAAEYDRTAFGDVEAARRRIGGIVAELRPSGDVLELACGTGTWTQALVEWQTV